MVRSESCTRPSSPTTSPSYAPPFSVTYKGGRLGYSCPRRTSSARSPSGLTSQSIAVRGRQVRARAGGKRIPADVVVVVVVHAQEVDRRTDDPEIISLNQLRQPI